METEKMGNNLALTHFARNISPVGIAFSITWLLLAAVLFSDAGVDIYSIYIAFAFTVAWTIVWSARLVWYSSRRHTALRLSVPSPVIFWTFEPIAFVFVAVLAYSDTLVLGRLSVSSFALARYANDVREGKIDLNFEPTHPTRLVGLYSISMTDALPNGGAQFITSRDGLFDKAGFAYLPNAAPPVRGKNSYTHIVGHWWRWQVIF